MMLISFPPYLWIWLGVILVLLIAVRIVTEIFFPERPFFWKYKYLKKEYFMTQPERDCFNALLRTVGNQYHVFPQVHLASVLNHKIRNQSWNGAFRHINQKSVDFVLCDKERIAPILTIELDDRTHERPDRQERDKEVERILSIAGLPLLRLRHDFIETELPLRIHEKITHELKWES